MSRTDFLSLLMCVRAVSAFSVPIMDCDETFNYWEPLHYLLFHNGLQPWEYSPKFALRSYSYLILHGIFLLPFRDILDVDKTTMFYILRGILGLTSAICEAKLCTSIQQRFGDRISYLTLLFLCVNSGMFHASTSFIPSTLCMYAVTVGYAYWFTGNHITGLVAGAFAVFQWPYVAPMFIPMGFDALYAKGFIKVLVCAVGSVLFLLLLPSTVDSYLYGKPVIPVLNQALYNVLGQGGGGEGANLYGTEPWHYYFVNLFLNLNSPGLIGLIAPLVIFVFPVNISIGEKGSKVKEKVTISKMELWMYLSGTLLTFFVFTALPHKEERFLTMMYPILCFGAAAAIVIVYENLENLVSKRTILLAVLRVCLIVYLAVTVLMSVSRSYALYYNFRAPQEIFREIGNLKKAPRSICMEKEWYRFPSSFFLPDYVKGDSVETTQILWLRSDFKGLLPQPYAEWPQGTRVIPDHMNDMNREDMHAYSDISDCEYAVDYDLDGINKGGLGTWADWEKVYCVPFLDSARSKPIIRSFYLPFGVLEKYGLVKYSDYCLLKRKRYS